MDAGDDGLLHAEGTITLEQLGAAIAFGVLLTAGWLIPATIAILSSARARAMAGLPW